MVHAIHYYKLYSILGDPIDLLRSRRSNVTEPYFTSIPTEERFAVKYLISDMYNPYISYVEKYFPNAISVVDSFHVIQWITRMIDNYIRQLLKKFRQRDREYQENYLLNSKCRYLFHHLMKFTCFRNTVGLFYVINQIFDIILIHVWIRISMHS